MPVFVLRPFRTLSRYQGVASFGSHRANPSAASVCFASPCSRHIDSGPDPKSSLVEGADDSGFYEGTFGHPFHALLDAAAVNQDTATASSEVQSSVQFAKARKSPRALQVSPDASRATDHFSMYMGLQNATPAFRNSAPAAASAQINRPTPVPDSRTTHSSGGRFHCSYPATDLTHQSSDNPSYPYAGQRNSGSDLYQSLNSPTIHKRGPNAESHAASSVADASHSSGPLPDTCSHRRQQGQYSKFRRHSFSEAEVSSFVEDSSRFADVGRGERASKRRRLSAS